MIVPLRVAVEVVELILGMPSVGSRPGDVHNRAFLYPLQKTDLTMVFECTGTAVVAAVAAVAAASVAVVATAETDLTTDIEC